MNSVRPSVCHIPTLYHHTLFSTDIAPIILVFPLLNIFTKSRLGPPVGGGALNTVGAYKFRDFFDQYLAICGKTIGPVTMEC